MKRSVEETATALFQTILRREPRADDIERFRKRLEATNDIVQVVVELANSQEAARYKIPQFVPAGHFYSPIVDTNAVRKHYRPHRGSEEVRLDDVDLNIERMARFWAKCLAKHAKNCPFPVQKEPSFRFHFENPAYSYGDAITLNAMLLHLRPRRIIEVGCGWSSACALDTVFGPSGSKASFTFIEPYPELLENVIWPEDRERIRIIPTPVQDVALSEFEALEENDVLFIDSTHVVKTGSDVVYELCEILPRLKKGVVIHFHDIFYPFEYGTKWVLEQNRSWNEIYALRNFLAFNNAFEVLFFNDMFARLRRNVLTDDCSKFLSNTGGAIWLRRKK